MQLQKISLHNPKKLKKEYKTQNQKTPKKKQN